MELTPLRAFLKVAELLHFTRAAEALHMSQQPLSVMIARLEDRIGARLFDRSTRSVRLTPAGETLRRHIEPAIAAIDRGARDARLVGQGQEGTLSLGYVSTSLYGVLPMLVRGFREQRPNVELALHELASPALEEALLKRELGAIITFEPPSAVSGLSFEPLSVETTMLVVSKGHALAGRASVTFKDLRGVPLIMYSRRTKAASYAAMMARLRAHGVEPVVAQEAGTEAAVLGLVAAGLGVGIVGSSLQGQRKDELVYVPMTGDSALKVRIVLGWNTEAPHPSVATLRALGSKRRHG